MGLVRIISIALLFLIASVTIADPISDITSQEVKAEVAIPNPFLLQGEWWQYLDSVHDNLEERVALVKKGIAQSLEIVSPETKNELGSNAQVIYGLLDNLVQLKSTESEINFPSISYKQSYEIQDFKVLFEKYHSSKSKAEQLAKITESEANKYKKALESNPELIIAYRDIKANTPNKLELGLKIMTNRLGWFVWKQREELAISNIKFLNEQQEASLKEIEYGANHLSVSNEHIKYIESQIDKQQNNIKKIRQEILNARQSYAKNLGIDYISRIKLKLFSQDLINAEIREKSAEIEQSINHIYKALILLSDNKGTETSNPIDIYQSNLTLYQETNNQISAWNEDTTQEQNDLQNLIASNVLTEDQKILDKVNEDRAKAVKITLEQLSLIQTEIFNFNTLNNVLEKKLGKSHGWGFKFQNTSMFIYEQTLLRFWKLLNTSLFELGEVPVTTWDIIQAILILGLAFLLARFLQRTLIKLNTNSEGKIPPAMYTLSRVIFYAVIVLGIFSAFASIGINFTNLAIVAGALSVGIGFGLQSVVNNFVSGVIILFEQNIKVGDFVELDSGLKGVVKDINVRSTIVNTLDNLDIIVPNSELVASKVTNFTLNEPIVRIHVPFGVAYGTDKEMVRKAVLEAVKHVPVTYDDGANRRPQVWLKGFGDSSLDFELVTWVSPKLGKAAPGSWKALYNWEIESALNRYDIEIPFPQRDLHIKSSSILVKPDYS